MTTLSCNKFFHKQFKTMTRGLMIVVEGCDRSGKSTQCELLVHNLKSRNIDSELVKFPGNKHLAVFCNVLTFVFEQIEQLRLEK